MKKMFLSFIMLSGVYSLGCGGPDINDISHVEEPCNVIVLCDISSSVTLIDSDDTSCYDDMIKNMTRHCADIIRHYPPGSRIYFYFVHSNAYLRPFFELTVRSIKGTTPQELREEFNSFEKTITRRIDSTSKHPEGRSCILTSIERAYKAFASIRVSRADSIQNELIIFSDMLEQCSSSSAGDIQMISGLKNAIFSKKACDSLALYKPHQDFTDLNVHVSVYTSSCVMYPQTADVVERTWAKVFGNFGTPDTPSTLKFSTLATFERRPIFDIP